MTEISLSSAPWSAAAIDAELGEGDALRTGESGRATLEVYGQGAIKIGPRSLVRIGVPDPSAPRDDGLRLVLETGEMEVEANVDDAPPLVLAGPSGERVRVEPGSRIRMLFDEAERLRLEVEEGTSQIEQRGETAEVAAGETFRFGLAERLADQAEPVPDAGVVDAGPADAGAVAQPFDAGPDAGPLQGVAIRNLGGGDIEIRPPGEEEYRPAGRRRLTVEPGTAIRVSGGRGVTIECCGGASVELAPGAQAVVRGVQGDRLSLGLRAGRAEARGGAGGVVALDAPGGSVETARTGVNASFQAAVRDRTSTRISVRAGAVDASTGGRRERVYTGGEIILGEASLRITRSAEVRPVFHGSAVVFDPQPEGSFTIRFEPIPDCSIYAIRVDRGESWHIDALTEAPFLALRDVGYGEYRWRAGCMVDGRPDWSQAREGRISRHSDRSGSFVMPTKAPRSTLDSDGRSYTVTYQNLLPAIALRWSRAPEAPSYTLEVVEDRTGRRVHRGRSSRPAAGFRSGFFRDGRYYWYFRAEGEGQSATSPVTFVQIAFDNVTPAVRIIEPREGAPASGSVRVRGVATVGSSVTANGVPLDLGADYRFDQQVPVGADGLLIIRVASPRRGVGHYLRHLGR